MALITNTAFELLQRSEMELLSQMPPDSSLASYEGMAVMLFYDIGMAHVDYSAKDIAHERGDIRRGRLDLSSEILGFV